jgi:hypothetical protein
MPSPDGREPSGLGAATRSARPHPQAGTSRSNAPTETATARTDRAVLLAPGIISPRQDHRQGRAHGGVACGDGASATLDTDLPRQNSAPIERTAQCGGFDTQSSTPAHLISRSVLRSLAPVVPSSGASPEQDQTRLSGIEPGPCANSALYVFYRIIPFLPKQAGCLDTVLRMEYDIHCPQTGIPQARASAVPALT